MAEIITLQAQLAAEILKINNPGNQYNNEYQNFQHTALMEVVKKIGYGDLLPSIQARGTTQDTRVRLQWGVNIVYLADVANYAVKLPAAQTVRFTTLVNNSGVALSCFPSFTGGSINGLVDTPVIIPADGQPYTFISVGEQNPGTWVVFIGSSRGTGGDVDYIRPTPMQITVGGATPGSTFTTTLQAAMDKILYPFVAPSLVYSISPILAEKGITVTSVIHSGTITANGKAISDRKILRNGVLKDSPAGNTINFNEASSLVFSDSLAERTSTLSFVYPNDNATPITVASTAVVSFAAPAYYGVGALGLNEAAIKGLTKVIKTTKGLSANFNPSNQRYYYAFPQSQGSITSIKDPNNFEVIASFTLTTANFTLADGVTSEPMNILTSNDNTTQVAFNLTFS